MFTDVAVFIAQVWLFQFAFLERQSVSTQVDFSFSLQYFQDPFNSVCVCCL